MHDPDRTQNGAVKDPVKSTWHCRRAVPCRPTKREAHMKAGLVLLLAQPLLALKILCLHGGGQSASSFENDAGVVALQNELGSSYEFVFPQAPYSGSLWMRDPPGGKESATTDPDWAADSISMLDQIVQDQGPFYGILGSGQRI